MHCLGNGSARAPTKDVPSRDSASGRRKEPVIRRFPNATSWSQGRSVRNGNPRNRSILVRGGKGINRDALSKGDRKGHWANRIPRRKTWEMWSSDSGTPYLANANSGGMPRPERVTAPSRYAGKVIRRIQSSVRRISRVNVGGIDIQPEIRPETDSTVVA